jgi:hypothetical protein
MDTGFATWKDVLEVLVIPVALGAVALLWPEIQRLNRQRAFRRLILRELREIAPFPEEPQDGLHWWDHMQKAFVHRQIFAAASENRDFILSLPPDLVYNVSQLWSALDHRNAVQWRYFLAELSSPKLDRTGAIRSAEKKWTNLIYRYQLQESGEYVL